MPATEQTVLRFRNCAIPFELKRSSRRTVGITVDFGGVRVTAPKRMSMERILELLATKAIWILKKQAEFEQKKPQPKRYTSGETFLYLGQEVVLELGSKPATGIQEQPKRPDSPALQSDLFSFDYSVPVVKSTKTKPAKTQVSLEGHRLKVSHAPNPRLALERWYKLEAEQVLKSRVEHYSQKLGWPTPKVLIRDQKRRWGSCNAKGELRFNWRLVMAPLAVLDYVVVHEMAHLKVLDHSSKFWRLVEQIMPDYKTHHRALHDLGPSLYW